MKKASDMVAEANAVIDHAPASEMLALHGQEGVTFVDLRDPRELEREGMIPGAFHCPRGMLEFWIDPESPYAKPQFQSGDRFVFYCASGWRSALSARTALTLWAQYMVVLVLQFIWRQRGSIPRGPGLRVSMNQRRSRHVQALRCIREASNSCPPAR